MGHVVIRGATVENGRIQALRVELAQLPGRTIDRDTAIAWMRDGHSFLPATGNGVGTSLQLVEVGEEASLFIRHDNAAVAEDALPALPAAE
jgi:hypothetical protein